MALAQLQMRSRKPTATWLLPGHMDSMEFVVCGTSARHSGTERASRQGKAHAAEKGFVGFACRFISLFSRLALRTRNAFKRYKRWEYTRNKREHGMKETIVLKK